MDSIISINANIDLKALREQIEKATKIREGTMKISTKPKCFECILPADRDGYCRGHWDFLFAGMNNHDRMLQAFFNDRDNRKEDTEL